MGGEFGVQFAGINLQQFFILNSNRECEYATKNTGLTCLLPLFIKKSIFIMKSMVTRRIVAPEKEALVVAPPITCCWYCIQKVIGLQQHHYTSSTTTVLIILLY